MSLRQGTVYPDVIESVSFKGPAAARDFYYKQHQAGDRMQAMGYLLGGPELFIAPSIKTSSTRPGDRPFSRPATGGYSTPRR